MWSHIAAEFAFLKEKEQSNIYYDKISHLEQYLLVYANLVYDNNGAEMGTTIFFKWLDQ